MKSPARALAALALLTFAVGGSGCKNRNKALAPIAVVTDGAHLDVQGDIRSAPVWAQVDRLVLSNGLLVHWLPEPDAARLHLRLLLPTDGDRSPPDAAALSVVAAALQQSVSRRTRGLRFQATVSSGPGRIELLMRSNIEDADRVLAAVGRTLGTDPSDKLLAPLIDQQRKTHKRISVSEAASTDLLSALLELPRAHLHSSRAEVDALTPDAVRKSYKSVVNPRRAVLLVHSAGDAAAFDQQLSGLAKSWRVGGPSLSAPEESAVARLRPDTNKGPRTSLRKRDAARLLGSPSAPLRVADELELPKRNALLTLGRIIPTPSARERALARIAQRIIGQDSDLRLVVAGPISVLILRARVTGSDARASVAKTVEKLERLADNTFSTTRIQQAARLWLGARVVAASLDDEDWTGLYAEALDLSDDDAAARSSLAVDARYMLEATPEDLQAFTKQWFAPRTGEAGWAWSIAGANDEVLEALEPLL